MNERISKTDRAVIQVLFLTFPLIAYVNLPGSLTIVSSLFIFAFFHYFKKKSFRTIASSFPLKIWLILTIYHWANAMIKNVPEVNIIDLIHGLKIYACIAIFSYLASVNFKKAVEYLLLTFNLYLLLSFLVNDLSSTELDGRMTGVIYSTALGQTAAITAIYLAYSSLINNWTILKTGFYCTLPLLVILLTQSRNALAMLGIIILGYTFSYSIKKGHNILKVSLSICLFAIITFYSFQTIVNETSLGSRLADNERTESMNYNNDRLTHTILDDIAGDRLVYYVVGWKYFQEQPITGIGMWNYRHITKTIYPLHSEYMVHLTEGGIIGFSLWVIFLISILKGLLRSKQKPYLKVLAIFSLAQILFCSIYARVFFYEFFYPAFGLIIALNLNGTRLSKTLKVNTENN